MKRLFLFLLTAVCLFGQSQNVTVIPSPGSGGMNTGTFSTQGINYYLGKTGTTWDFSQVTLILPSSLAFVSTITAGAGINVSQSTGAVTISNTGVLAITPGSGITESIVGGTVTLNNSGVLAITAGNGVSVSGTQANITINAIAAGTVNNVSAVGQNGIGATTTNSTTNPVITLNLGSITPNAVTTSGLESVGFLKTTALTGYLYGNSSSNVSASTTIPSTAITGLATVATTGNYNDLLNKPTLNAGTVTSVATSGSVNGITLTGGPITSSGTITLGGTLSGISNSQLTNNSITVTAGTGLSGGGTVALGGTITLNASGGGTVSSVSVSPNSGVTAGVTNSTTTPTISIGLGAITPTSVTTNTMTFGVNTGVLTVTTGTVGSAAITGSGQAVFNSGPSISAPTITGAATAVNLTTSGLESVANLKTSGLTGYLYGNSTTNVTASTTIPTSSLSGSVSLTSQVSGILPIANGGTGSSTASLVAGTGIAITGTFPNQTINATSGTGTVTSVAGTGTVQGITLTGTVTTSGSLTLGGSLSPIALATQVSGTLNASSGGTGVAGTITGYEYANGTGAHTASTTIPTTALSGTITNAQLTNNSITVTAGSGLSGGGSVALGGTTTLTNAGVTNIVAGTGITVNAATGSVTINSTATGSVTSVSVTGNSGVLAGVATATTTPAISIGLGNITPTSVNAPIGNTTPSTGAFTTLNSSGQTLLATSAGKVGIGAVLSPWGSYYAAIESYSGAAFSITTQVNDIEIGSNFYRVNSGFANIYATTGYTNPSKYVQTNGVHQWFTAPSGTAGNVIPFTQEMTLDASGNLLVNSTSALSGGDSNLFVNGSILSNYGNAGLSANTNEGYTQYNLYYGGTPSTDRIRNTGYAGRFAFNLANGYLAYYVSTSTVAGGGAGMSEKFRIDSSGELLLGTTTPVATGAGSLTVGATTASTSTTSGALQVAGGVGVGGALNVGGKIVSYLTTSPQILAAPSSGNAYIQSARTSSSAGQVGYEFATGSGVDWLNYEDTSSNDLNWYSVSVANAVMRLSSAGVLQLNTYGAGTLVTNSSGVISASSDARLKNVKHPFTTGLKAITQIHPAVYSWKSEEKEGVHTTYAGFIAQDVQKAIPEAVGQGKDGYLTLQDRAITAALVNAIKEQQKEIEDLQQQIKQLSKQP